MRYSANCSHISWLFRHFYRSLKSVRTLIPSDISSEKLKIVQLSMYCLICSRMETTRSMLFMTLKRTCPPLSSVGSGTLFPDWSLSNAQFCGILELNPWNVIIIPNTMSLFFAKNGKLFKIVFWQDYTGSLPNGIKTGLKNWWRFEDRLFSRLWWLEWGLWVITWILVGRWYWKWKHNVNQHLHKGITWRWLIWYMQLVNTYFNRAVSFISRNGEFLWLRTTDLAMQEVWVPWLRKSDFLAKNSRRWHPSSDECLSRCKQNGGFGLMRLAWTKSTPFAS